MALTRPITISDEEQPTEGATKDTDEPRQIVVVVEPTVTTKGETVTVTDQPPNEVGLTTEADAATNPSVDTGDRKNTEVES